MKLTKEMLENIVLEEYEAYMEELSVKEQEKLAEENKMTVKELRMAIREVIAEKVSGSMFNKMHDLYIEFQKKANKLAKQKWIRIAQGLKEKDGAYSLILIGNGNKKLVIKWDSNDNKERMFHFSTGESLIAGDEFSMALYEFMMALTHKRDAIYPLLKELESGYNAAHTEGVAEVIQNDETPEDMEETPEEE